MPYDTGVALQLQSGLAVGIPSSGSVAANGALTLNTALPLTLQNAWLYFPAGAVYAGSPAGFYFCQMTSGTAGTIFGNYSAAGVAFADQTGPGSVTQGRGVPGQPFAAALQPIVAAGPGSYTQVTAAVALLTIPIPGNLLGRNGCLRFDGIVSVPNNGNNKTLNLTYGSGGLINANVTSVNGVQLYKTMYNRGSANVQVTTNGGLFSTGTVTAANAQISVDSTQNQNLAFNATLANAADYVILEAFSVEALQA
jgi:hypothetical protein